MTDLKADALDKAFEKRFNRKVETTWNIFAGNSGAWVTSPANDQPLTEVHFAWLNGWSDRTLA